MRRGLGEEDILHKDFASVVRKYNCYSRLKNIISWTYNASGEKRSKTTGSLLKAKGLAKGVPDFLFRKRDKDNICHNIWLEFKTPTGKQSKSQIEFEEKCTCANERYYLPRSVKEGLDILIKEDLLSE